MKTTWLGAIIPFLYLLLAGFIFASELYKRIYDRGNSEMAGLGTYLITMPSSSLVNWVSESLFGVTKIGDTDTTFAVMLGLSVILNTVLIYLITIVLISLARRAFEIH